ncbi:MAG TPA: ATP-binding cassette domain-containing protein, partial [Anaerolineales bacterium]|nr:ATP-binding cassette domain-containing protein [Anaerolineales bacterium]
FGTLQVVRDVSFEVQPGEVVGVTGSIGSGKSVLMMILAGMYTPNGGEVYFKSKRLNWPFAANAMGISVIHQRPNLDEQLDIVSNIFLGNELGWPAGLGPLRILDTNRMYHESRRILYQLGLEVSSLNEKAANLSGVQRQMIAIARALTFPASMIIIDEPMVLLSYPFQQRLLSLIQDWRRQGVAVLFSSNNIDHLFAVTDRIIVLNQGVKAADLRTDETTREDIVSLLLGTSDPQKPAPTVWDYDSYERIREHTEKMRYHQMLLGKDLVSEPTLNRQLTEQLAEQVQALDQANLALLEAQRRLLSEREQERKHLARELHDQVIQDLLTINYDLEVLEIEQDMPPSLANITAEIRNDVRELVNNLRRICSNLRPLTIDSLGLGAALQSFTREWSIRTGIKVELDLDSNLGRLPEAIELSLFRIVQEGLNNVWRHAEASCVQISLQHTSPRALMVSIHDDGTGISEEIDLADLAKEGHYGLMGISERVALMRGRFRMQRTTECGSRLLVEIPHPRVDVNAESDD